MTEMMLAFFDYGYKVKTLEGKNQEGYVTGVSEDGKIKISLDKKPYSGKHDIIKPASNLEILTMNNPYDICDIKYDVEPENQTEFFMAKLDLLLTNPQTILDNKKYFTVLLDDDWIELAEKAVKKYDKRFIKSLKKRLEEEDKR